MANSRMLIQVIEDPDSETGIWAGGSEFSKHFKFWSELRAFSQDNNQDFSASGSAGILAATGRVGMNDFTVEKSVDPMSANIFDACCRGKSVNSVVIEVWDDVDNYSTTDTTSNLTTTLTKPRVTIVLDQGVNFSHYKIDGSRYFGVSTNNYNLNVPAAETGGNLSGTATLTKDAGFSVTTKEIFKLWFTRMRIRYWRDAHASIHTFWNTGTKGWDAGSNEPDEKEIAAPKIAMRPVQNATGANASSARPADLKRSVTCRHYGALTNSSMGVWADKNFP